MPFCRADRSTEFSLVLATTPPDNRTHYVDGEKPQIAITVKDVATIIEADWSQFRLQVSGPREHTEPVLSSAAADISLSGSSSYVYNDLRVRTDPTKEDFSIVRSTTSINSQLGDVAGLKAGTYTVFVQARLANNPSSAAVLNFQVGTETEEAKICTNCTDCHDDTRMHSSYPFDPDLCKSCHDSDEAISHGTLMTFDLTSNDPFSGDEVETCIICHGEHADFSPKQMHNISDPYKPPYPRERQGGD